MRLNVLIKSYVPVEGDGAEVEDGGRAAEDVEGEPGLADEAAEHPP